MTDSATILLVEDDRSLLNGIAELLEVANTGYAIKVLRAANGREGLEALAKATPDLVISDIMMPKLGGFEFLRRLRQNPATVHIPVIFISARGSKQDVLKGRLMGAELYITKPFDNDELLDLVGSQLDRAFELQVARERALRNLKRGIIDLLNHEFRTPLTYVTAYYEMLADSLETEHIDNLQEYLRGIQIGALRLLQIVDDFIMVVELRSGEAAAKFTENARPIRDTPALFREACRYFQEVEAGISVEIRCQVPDGLPPVYGVGDYLVDACGRLVDNAIKFSRGKRHNEPKVSVSAGTRNGALFFSVKDNGVGMPERVIDQVFDLFFQHNRAEFEQQGSGTGLTIAKGLVELHGGRIEVESENGVGSTFTICLPIYDSARRLLSRPQAAGAKTRATVLIVEDEWYLLNGLRDLLLIMDSDYELSVLTASNGLEGLEVLADNQPDLIISDIMMPRMDGYEFLARVRESPQWVQIPFIFLTAKGERRDVLRGRRSGVEEYITKPYESDELMELVVTQLDRHFQRQGVISQGFEELKRTVLDLLLPGFHDPLSSVSDYSEKLAADLEDIRTEADLKASLQVIQVGSNRINRMVEDFILLAELQAGEVAASFEGRAMPLNPATLLLELTDGWRQTAGDVNIVVQQDLEMELAPVLLDFERFGKGVERVLQALLDLCHSKESSDLYLQASTETDLVRISIGSRSASYASDVAGQISALLAESGPAVKDLVVQNAGLAIAKLMVNLHGGDIALDNQEGVQCRFVITLPVHEPALET